MTARSDEASRLGLLRQIFADRPAAKPTLAAPRSADPIADPTWPRPGSWRCCSKAAIRSAGCKVRPWASASPEPASLAGGEASAELLCRLGAERRPDPGEIERGAGFAVAAVTVAIGVAAHRSGEPLARRFGRAERARALAKPAGGNQTVVERVLIMISRPKR